MSPSCVLTFLNVAECCVHTTFELPALSAMLEENGRRVCKESECREADLHSDPTVSCLDVASCVPDVTEHLVVGEI